MALAAKGLGRHAAALAVLASVMALWVWPVLARIAEVVPGAGPGDNLTFVWDLGWMRHALREGHPLLFSPLIFHPFGVDLTLHTHTALPSVLAAVIAPDAPLLAVSNVIVVAHLFLNFALAYALAFRLTRHVGGALVASLVFGASPYVVAHLAGHFNLMAAWVLPLVALATLKTLDARRAGPWLLGAALAIALYIDYYYAVYGVLLVATLAVADTCGLALAPSKMTRARRIASHALAVMAFVAGVVVIAILTTGGTVIALAGVTVSLRNVTNPLSAFWTLLILRLAVRWVPRLRFEPERVRVRRHARGIAIALALLLLAALPLLVRVGRLWWSGDYVTQQYFWRSGPAGIDAGTLILGNPGGRLAKGLVLSAYSRFDIDPVEEVGWIGPGVVMLCALAWMRRRADPGVLAWFFVAGVFGLWALGPRLVLFGRDTGLLLPALGVRFLPIVSNARMPGRAIVVVYLALAVLSAFALRALARGDACRRHLAAAALALLVIADYAPAAPAIYAPGRPHVYDALASGVRQGAVLELPLGLRDGFGEIGRLDSRVLYYQWFHRRPILGGFVARLPPSVIERYRAMPIVSALLRLSGGAPLGGEDVAADRDAAAAALAAADIRFVVLNVRHAPPDLVAFVEQVLDLEPLAADDERVAYAVRARPH